MLIKLIYEDEQLQSIKEQIKNLETNQLYFLEEFIRREKKKENKEFLLSGKKLWKQLWKKKRINSEQK